MRCARSIGIVARCRMRAKSDEKASAATETPGRMTGNGSAICEASSAVMASAVHFVRFVPIGAALAAAARRRAGLQHAPLRRARGRSHGDRGPRAPLCAAPRRPCGVGPLGYTWAGGHRSRIRRDAWPHRGSAGKATMSSPLVEAPLFWVGPVPVTGSVLTSFGITAALAGSSVVLTRRMTLEPTRIQAGLELVVSAVDDQIRDVVQRDPKPYAPLVGSLFLYLVVANCIDVVPFLHSPTARLETTMALALVVFFAVYVYGIRANGVRGYLRHFVRPTPLLAPIHVLSEVTRTFALMMRLLGNIMSHGLVLAIVVSLAGLLVPVPVMAFGLFVGLVQAYIFAILATVYVGAAVEAERTSRQETSS